MLHYSACVVTLPHCMTIYLNQRAVEHIWGSGDPWPYRWIVHSTGSFWNQEDILSRDTGPLTPLDFCRVRIREYFTGSRPKIYKRKVSCFQNGETFASYHSFLTVLRNTSQQTSSVSESEANYFQLQSVPCVWSLVASYYPANIWFSFF